MFLILIILAAVLLFVLFAKRPVNMAGLHVGGSFPIDPPKPQAPHASEPVAPAAPAHVDTVNFNDIFGAKPAPKSDQPNQ
jgi:hypothetical protein